MGPWRIPGARALVGRPRGQPSSPSWHASSFCDLCGRPPWASLSSPENSVVNCFPLVPEKLPGLVGPGSAGL